MAGLAVLLGSMVGFGGTAHAGAGMTCDFYLYNTDLYLICLGGPAVTVDPGTVSPGQTLTITLSGWKPDSTVAVSIEVGGQTYVVGDVTVDSNGQGTTTWVVPADSPVGPASGIGDGLDFVDQVAQRSAPFEVVAGGGGAGSSTTASGGGSGNLPVTGSDSGRLVGLGAALIVIGAAAVYGAARSRRQRNAA